MLTNPDCVGLRPQSCPPASLETGIVTNTLRRNPGKLLKIINSALQISTEASFRGGAGRGSRGLRPGSGDFGATLLGQPGGGLVQRLAEGVQHFGDLRLVDDHRRAAGDGVAEVAEDDAVVLRPRREIGAGPADRVEGRLGRLVGDPPDRCDQADAPHLPDPRLPGEAPTAPPHPRTPPADTAHPVAPP